MFCSCKHKQPKTVSHSKREDSIANEKALWHYADSIQSAFIRSVREPHIDTFKHEVYRYWVDLVFHPDFTFRLEDINGKWMLTSRWIQDECAGCKTDISIIVHGKTRKTRYGSVIDSSVQELTTKQWNTFHDLLEGSYYRCMQSPDCDDGILDGNSLILETMSMTGCCCKPDSLHYYHVGVHVPREGSFKQACKYLMSISLLLEPKNWRRDLWRIM
ncbi:hypothetical protein DN068_13685 [Taibaiella soli]|uniref:Uncharacterized protein n=1 Tax=Taibaiella soli TaxID=1649169 RepID=A0A2W2AJG4_9BACT|nr:hypothetical protein DN068_13685 [Taibaiella soli]